MAHVALAVALAAVAGVAVGTCPNLCSGHGDCSFDHLMLCECYAGYTGPDCSERTCSTGYAWVGFATTTDGLHSQLVECSNKVRARRWWHCCSGDGGDSVVAVIVAAIRR
jgi:hypothetical protein